MQRSIFYPLIFLVGFTSFTAVAQNTKMLLVHTRYDVPDTTNEYLLSFSFKKGKFINADTILHRSRVKESKDDGRISVGPWDDRIIQGRYLYTSIGLITDLKEKKVLREDANMEFIKEEGSKFYFNNTFFNCTLDMFEYDLDKHTYKNTLKRPFDNYCFRPELCSPDYNHFLEPNYRDIYVVDSNGKKKRLVKGEDLPDPVFSGARTQGKMALAWTDNDHFIYPKYIIHKKDLVVKPDPPKNNKDGEMVFERVKPYPFPFYSVELTEVNIHTGEQRFVTTINGLYEPYFDDKLIMLGDQLMFRNVGIDTMQLFCIDRQTGEATTYQRKKEEGFHIVDRKLDGDENPPFSDVMYGDKSLGYYYILRELISDSAIVICGSIRKEEPDMLFVWTLEDPQWQVIPVRGFLGFFGWINKTWNE